MGRSGDCVGFAAGESRLGQHATLERLIQLGASDFDLGRGHLTISLIVARARWASNSGVHCASSSSSVCV